MRVELSEHSVKLFPESDFEIKALKRLRDNKVDDIKFEDDWESEGYLELCHPKHEWDK